MSKTPATSLQGKTAVVTGGATGIGRAICLEMAKAGAHVAVHHEPAQAQGQELAEQIRCSGGDAAAFAADLLCTAHIPTLFAAVEERFGRIDILVNNAAVDPGSTLFREVPEGTYDSVLGVNLKAAYFCSQQAAERMAAQGGGKILHISSVHAKATVPHRTLYAAAKGGVEALTRAMALDLAPHRINVNALAPGFIEVERTISQTSGYSREAVGATIPWGRVGIPGDIAAVAVFLCSAAADYITGQVLAVDGGLGCRLAR